MAAKVHSNHSQRRLLTDAAIRTLQPGQTATESLPGRGSGAILFEARISGAIDSYFRVRSNGKSSKTKIGKFKVAARSGGLTLSEIREKARELSSIALEHGDVKRFLNEKLAAEARERQERELAFAEARRAAEEEAARGTLSELFQDYIESLRGTRSPEHIRELERVLNNELKSKSPAIVNKKAKDIKPDHIRDILQPVWDRDAKSMSDKIRAYLHSAFEYGLKNEFSLRRRSSKTFSLESNPVSALPRDHKTPAITRSLNDQELHHFWHSIQNFNSAGPVVSRLFLFLIAAGGQRIRQVIREPWSSYDLSKGILHTQHRKGNGEPRIHLVPLTRRAIDLLSEVHSINPYSSHPWSTNGKSTIDINTLGNTIEKWLSSENSRLAGEEFLKFTPRDLRRTCSQIMLRIKITTEDSNILQAHGLSGVVAKHYHNNPYSYLPGLRETINKYDDTLEKIINKISYDEKY